MPSNITSEWLHTTWTEQLNLWFVVGYLIPGKEGMHQESYQRIDHAAARLLYWDSQHLNTFYAVSIFKEQGNRKQANVAYVGMFWGDIDVAPKSSYPDAYAAALACRAVCNRLSLPIPIMVFSGRGLHIYWLLD